MESLTDRGFTSMSKLNADLGFRMFSNGESLDLADDPLDNSGDLMTLLGEAGMGLYQSSRFDPAVFVEIASGFVVKGLCIFGSVV